jgi:hypothetical protein
MCIWINRNEVLLIKKISNQCTTKQTYIHIVSRPSLQT